MKCHLCVNYIEMQTDPATCDYVIVSGAQRKEERWNMAENEQILTTGKCSGYKHKWCIRPMTLHFSGVRAHITFFYGLAEHNEKEKLETDAMYKLDHGGKDKEKLRAAIPTLTELQEQQEGWKDDFQLNSSLRKKFRVSKTAPLLPRCLYFYV